MTSDHPRVQIRRLHPKNDSDIPLPRYMTPQSSGMDLCAAIEQNQVIPVGSIAVIPTGIAIALPPGFEAQIRPRSGLAFKHGIAVINAPGTIDADYRGEIRIGLVNLGEEAYTVRRGDRVAQIILQKVYQAELEVVDTLEETERNEGGFGHTGT
jgi:dUTP pyrophosphatase